MSLVFLAGERVYKLKRPIELDFLDFRSVSARRRSCEAEFEINQKLAPGVYLEALPITVGAHGLLALGGKGEKIDWVVVMRRLDNSAALDRLIKQHSLQAHDLGRVCETLAQFYLTQSPVAVTGNRLKALWQEKIGAIRKSLSDPRFALPRNLIDHPLAALDTFVAKKWAQVGTRLANGWIVDGHGDLKPEHIYIGDEVLIIDRIEFDERLRWCDPFDEIVFLGLECEKLGGQGIAAALIEGLADRLGDRPSETLLQFYRVYRACMRARLMIEHLRDEAPRTPEKWPRQALAYLNLANEALAPSHQS
ncbi:hypothetical protein FGU71_06865 [Erythrobacter insulae]|uniref:Aminoglycoside phosphotransferase domain-containing protein n=1 Tax=Erythrobacter insulae TaxID=2584124 RepID=A0A547PBU9_9SPHN|nr:hypothetical protein [Erythrobacter insulae]TRD11611.1 hypothetical protein FGU71_06865 [Erythrobacter insulae]